MDKPKRYEMEIENPHLGGELVPYEDMYGRWYLADAMDAWLRDEAARMARNARDHMMNCEPDKALIYLERLIAQLEDTDA